ncbi:MAG TPA: peptide deformylase [Candidatus Tenderia electrophaga]|uniref:Peptide deformylase n=1 Tax=Candidatus Tenderia electrophaga TaxID=1748243 RepID=A0A832N4W5_9GAMM|nr:peptide deformylase [Candidatus Tenderia electrophaga]
MSLIPILFFPDERLRRQCRPVSEVDAKLRQLIDDMFETMYEAPGIGLAAPQVGVFERLMVIDISEDKNAPQVFINPELLETRGVELMEEGCLSVPGIYEDVERADWIRVRALDRNGDSFEKEVSGLEAVCIQHEIDHLDGKLFVDYLSGLKRQRIRKKMEKQRRQTL